MTTVYYSLDDAYGAASLKNTPSEYSGMQRPCLVGYPDPGTPALSDHALPVQPWKAWDDDYLDVADAYAFPKKYPYATR